MSDDGANPTPRMARSKSRPPKLAKNPIAKARLRGDRKNAIKAVYARSLTEFRQPKRIRVTLDLPSARCAMRNIPRIDLPLGEKDAAAQNFLHLM
jgi:hypothetical protein